MVNAPLSFSKDGQAGILVVVYIADRFVAISVLSAIPTLAFKFDHSVVVAAQSGD